VCDPCTSYDVYLLYHITRPPSYTLFPYTTLFRSQDQLLDAFINKKVTIASLVTVMLKDLTQKLEDRKLPSSVRCILLGGGSVPRSEEHTSELQSRFDLVCRLLLEKKNNREKP